MFSRQKKQLETKVVHHYVTFSLDDEEYGIPIANIREVIQIGRITSVPHSPDFLAGVMDMRGKIISMIDLRRKFNLEDFEKQSGARESRRAIVVNINDKPIGLIVDKVNKVVQFGSEIESAPPTVKGIRASNIIGIGKVDSKFVILLNIEKILTDDEMAAIQEHY